MSTIPVSPPESCAQLCERAHALAGRTLGDLAAQFQISAPNLKREKGWIGQCMEMALGADSGSLAQPDFAQLGIELKTIPVDKNGLPMESTWVCVAPLLPAELVPWQHSVVAAKLALVLWVPIESDTHLDWQQRRIGHALLWQADPKQQQCLQQDYEYLTEMIALGHIEQITARHGEALQLRPKAANRRVLTEAIGPEGNIIRTLPRGFYLRQRFTRALFRQHYL